MASIKRYISKAEDIPDRSASDLYKDSQSQEPLNDEDLIPILTGTGPGSDPKEPLALVIIPQAPVARPSTLMGADSISSKGILATSGNAQIF